MTPATAEGGSMRLFVALEVPETWKQALTRVQEQAGAAVRRRLGERVKPRWVRPEGIHLTLKFLGQTPAARIEALEAALKQAVDPAPAFRLSLGEPGSFAGRRAPRVLFVKIGGDVEALAALARRVEACLETAGWPPEGRAFQPHLTLARLPESIDDATCRAVAALTASCAAPRVSAWTVERVSLMRSHLGPGGARYERIASLPD